MVGSFEKEYIVKYYDCGNNNEITFPQLIRYTQETSTLHTTQVGCNTEYLTKNQIGWILLENHCKIYKYPKVNERFRIKTWVNDIQRLYAIRHYEITDQEGNLVLQSYTRWIMYSFERKRPIKVPEEVKNMYIYTEEKTITIDNIDFSQELKIYNNVEDKVLYKDVDTNWHMNNVAYIQSTMETMKKEFLDENEVTECLIKYTHQLLYNTPFRIDIKKINEQQYIYSINEKDDIDIVEKKSSNADIYLKWRKKSESNC